MNGRATSSTGAPFHQEYMFLIHFREESEGWKIFKVEEFLDTGFSRDFFRAERLRRMERKRDIFESRRRKNGDHLICAKMWFIFICISGVRYILIHLGESTIYYVSTIALLILAVTIGMEIILYATPFLIRLIERFLKKHHGNYF